MHYWIDRWTLYLWYRGRVLQKVSADTRYWYRPKPSLYTRYQRESQNQTGIFGVEEHNRTDVNTVQCRHESKIKDGHLIPEVKNETTQYLSF